MPRPPETPDTPDAPDAPEVLPGCRFASGRRTLRRTPLSEQPPRRRSLWLAPPPRLAATIAFSLLAAALLCGCNGNTCTGFQVDPSADAPPPPAQTADGVPIESTRQPPE